MTVDPANIYVVSQIEQIPGHTDYFRQFPDRGFWGLGTAYHLLQIISGADVPPTVPALQLFFAGSIYDIALDSWSLIGNSNDNLSEGQAASSHNRAAYMDDNTGSPWINVGGVWVDPGALAHTYPQDVAVSANGTVWAFSDWVSGGVGNHTLYKSTDLGTTWSSVYSLTDPGSSPDTIEVTLGSSIATHPTDSNKIAVVYTRRRAIGDSLRNVYVAVSIDGGSSFTEYTAFTSGTVSPTTWTTGGEKAVIGWHDNGDIVVAFGGFQDSIAFTTTVFIYTSSNDGATWSQAFKHNSSTLGNDFGAEPIEVTSGESHVYVVTNNSILYDYDGASVTAYEANGVGSGATALTYAASITSALTNNSIFYVWEGPALYANGIAVTSCPYIAGAPNLSVTRLRPYLRTPLLYSPGYWYDAISNAWGTIGNPNDASALAAESAPGRSVYVDITANVIRSTRDQGLTWQAISPRALDTYLSSRSASVAPAGSAPGLWALVGNSGGVVNPGIIYTVDEGTTWTLQFDITTLPDNPPSYDALIRAHPTDSSKCAVLFRQVSSPYHVIIAWTTDTGTTWNTHNLGWEADHANIFSVMLGYHEGGNIVINRLMTGVAHTNEFYTWDGTTLTLDNFVTTHGTNVMDDAVGRDGHLYFLGLDTYFDYDGTTWTEVTPTHWSTSNLNPTTLMGGNVYTIDWDDGTFWKNDSTSLTAWPGGANPPSPMRQLI